MQTAEQIKKIISYGVEKIPLDGIKSAKDSLSADVANTLVCLKELRISPYTKWKMAERVAVQEEHLANLTEWLREVDAG